MARKSNKAETETPALEINPVFVEFRVVAELRRNGKFVDHVAAADKIPEVDFEHAPSLKQIIDRARNAMLEKYSGAK